MNSWFTRRLLKWNSDENHRQMPWKGEKDPYKIWLSEIILQQTRVEQGTAYYNRFIERYPSIRFLAAAPDQEVFKLWEGLGYYSRCRNMIAAARSVMQEREGIFPDHYDDILSLPGIGPYTAAAISSFAFNLPNAVLDGNVFRVLSRFFGIDMPIDTDAGKKHFNELASEQLDRKYPAAYNQAIMDLGATVCKPKNPLCEHCPLADKCVAFIQGNPFDYPVKSKKIKRRTRFFIYLLVEIDQMIMIRERTSKDIWKHLFEFVLIETDSIPDEPDLMSLIEKSGINRNEILEISTSARFRQQLTHQEITGNFNRITLRKKRKPLPGYQWEKINELKKLPFPRYILSYMEEKK